MKKLLILLLIVGCDNSTGPKNNINFQDFSTYLVTDEYGNSLYVVGEGVPYQCYEQNFYDFSNETIFKSDINLDIIESDTTDCTTANEYGFILAGCNSVDITVAQNTIIEQSTSGPNISKILPPYPNPSDGSINIPITIASTSDTQIFILDENNNMIDIFINQVYGAGNYMVSYNLNEIQLNGGIYKIVVDYGALECFSNIKYATE